MSKGKKSIRVNDDSAEWLARMRDHFRYSSVAAVVELLLRIHGAEFEARQAKVRGGKA